MHNNLHPKSRRVSEWQKLLKYEFFEMKDCEQPAEKQVIFSDIKYSIVFAIWTV